MGRRVGWALPSVCGSMWSLRGPLRGRTGHGHQVRSPFRPVQIPLCTRAPGGENEHILSSCPKWKTPPCPCHPTRPPASREAEKGFSFLCPRKSHPGVTWKRAAEAGYSHSLPAILTQGGHRPALAPASGPHAVDCSLLRKEEKTDEGR